MAMADNVETKDEGIVIMEEGKRDSGHFEASSVCFDGLFADLGEIKERSGDLTITMPSPTLVSIVDKLSALGMEELMKKRFYDQLDSLRDFTKIHGDCRVPADHPTLGGWVRLQHKHYMLCKKRLPSPLTSKRFTKLKEISGFDEFETPREEKKEDSAGAKLSAKTLGAEQAPREEKKDDSVGAKLSAKALGAQEAQGKTSPSDTSLALDEKIRLKTAMNKVRLMAKATKGFSPTKDKLPDKEVVAAQIRRKRAKGTSHRLAVRNSQRMTKSFISVTSDNNSILDLSAKSGHSKEGDEGPGPATEDGPKDEPPSITAQRTSRRRSLEEAIQKKLAEDDRDKSAPVGATAMGGGGAPAVNGYEGRLEKMMRKFTAEGGGDPAAAGEGTSRQRVSFPGAAARGSERGKNDRSIDGSGEGTRKKMVDRSRSMPAQPAIAGSTFEDQLSGSLEGILGDRVRGNRSSAGGEATGKRMGAGHLGRSMPIGTGGGGNGSSRRFHNRTLGASTTGSTFEERLSRKLDGESLEEIYGNRAGGNGSSAAGEVTRKKMGAGDRSQSMLVGMGGGGNADDRRLGASVPTNLRRSSFDDRLRRKMDGETLEEIYEDRAGGGRSSAAWVSLEDEASDDDSVHSLNSFDGCPRRHASGSWMDKLNGPGDSRDDMGVPRRLESWTDLDETLPPGRKYSRWKLVFCKSDCDDGSVQSDCISTVLNTVIYSERWHVVPKENGEVALEMTTRTPDEHKTVELYVQQMDDLYSRSDFYFY